MATQTYDIETLRERGMLRHVHHVVKAGRGLWVSESNRRPLYIQAEEWELLDAGIEVQKAKNHGLGRLS